MTTGLVLLSRRELARKEPPAIVANAGGNTRFAYSEFFDPAIDNDHTHRAYRHAADTFPTTSQRDRVDNAMTRRTADQW